MFELILKRRIRKLGVIWTIVFDVDGVLTDGGFWYGNTGKILKRFGPHDNEGAKALSRHHQVVFISADIRGQKITRKRIQDMGFELNIQSAEERLGFIKSIKGMRSPVAFIADSVSDIPALNESSLSMCPKSASKEVRQAVDHVLTTPGGYGVVAEVAKLFSVS